MKTTPEQRKRWKENRRLAGWHRIINKLDVRIARSQWTFDVCDRALEVIQSHPCLASIQDAIRRTN